MPRNNSMWWALSACAAVVLLVGGLTSDAQSTALPVILVGDTTDDCQLVLKTTQFWKETNGVAGLQTEMDDATKTPSDKFIQEERDRSTECNIENCPENLGKCEKQTLRDKEGFVQFCKCTDRQGHCQGVLRGKHGGKEDEGLPQIGTYGCEGFCGRLDKCDDSKRITTHTVDEKKSKGAVYHVTATRICKCPDP